MANRSHHARSSLGGRRASRASQKAAPYCSLPERARRRRSQRRGCEQLPQQGRVDRPGRGQPTVAVAAFRPVRAAPGKLVQDHVAGAAVEADQRCRRSLARREGGEVGDPADVQCQHRHTGPGQQPAIDDRDQGRAATAGRDVILAEIGDHRAAQPLGQHGRLADLQAWSRHGRAPPSGHGCRPGPSVDGEFGCQLPRPLPRMPRRPPGSAAPARARRAACAARNRSASAGSHGTVRAPSTSRSTRLATARDPADRDVDPVHRRAADQSGHDPLRCRAHLVEADAPRRLGLRSQQPRECAAVDQEVLAGDVAGMGRAQEGAELPELGGLAEPAGRARPQPRRARPPRRSRRAAAPRPRCWP